MYFKRACFLVGLALALGCGRAAAEEPKPLTPEQKAQLQERDRLGAEALKLGRAGKLDEMVALWQKKLAIERAVFGDVHEEVAASLVTLARMHEFREDFEAARKARREVLTLRTQLHREKDWRVMDARLTLADLELQARLDKADRQRLRQAEALNEQAVELWQGGRAREALPLARQALEIRRQLLTENHPTYALSLHNLALLYQAMGDYGKALPLYEQARGLYKKLLTENHPHYAHSLNNLAGLYRAMGDYGKALPLYEQAHDLTKKLLTENHPDYATSLNNLATLYQAMGDYGKALPLYEQAHDLTKKLLTENHPDYATSLNNLAGLYHDMGDHSRALPLYKQACDLTKKLLTENHPDYATSLNNLGGLYQDMGDYSKALSLCEQARDLRKKLLTENHPDYAQSLNSVALLYKDMGDHAKALPLYEEACDLSKKLLTENHPLYALSLSNLAALYHSMGNHAKAAPLAGQALRSRQAFLDRTLAAQSDRQRLDLLLRSRSYVNSYLTCLAPARPVAAPQVYSALLPWKAAAAARRAEELLARDRPDLRPITDQLRLARAGLARLAQLTPANPQQRDDWLQRFDALEADKERLERTLADKSAAFRRFRDVRQAGAAEVVRALPEGTALVDFVAYRHFTRKPKAKPPWEVEGRLLAFVVRRDSEPVCLPLGKTEDIDKAVQAWRDAVLRGQDPEADGARLAGLVWRPLVEHLGDADTVLLAPDGPLALVPFAALPGSKPGTFLLEERTLGYVSSGRHLLELAADSERPPSAGLLALGGLDYGPRPAGSTAVAVKDGPGGLERSPEVNPHLFLQSAFWKPLPGTRFEAEGVVRAYRDHFRAGPAAQLLGGGEADAARLRRELTASEGRPRWRYLHLATHGYYQPPAPLPGKAGPEDPFAFDRSRAARTAGRNPLLLSGLVLSGANRAPEQGTLSAEEASVLDLRGVELAVLSACETGLGKVDLDGVQSLQRAFQMAGGRTLVSSLWKVNDAATSVLMEEFYANLWHKQLPKVEALRQAQLAVLKDPERVRRRQAELTKAGLRAPEEEAAPLPKAGTGGGRSHPVLWAAFTLSGDVGKDSMPAR